MSPLYMHCLPLAPNVVNWYARYSKYQFEKRRKTNFCSHFRFIVVHCHWLTRRVNMTHAPAGKGKFKINLKHLYGMYRM